MLQCRGELREEIAYWRFLDNWQGMLKWKDEKNMVVLCRLQKQREKRRDQFKYRLQKQREKRRDQFKYRLQKRRDQFKYRLKKRREQFNSSTES